MAVFVIGFGFAKKNLTNDEKLAVATFPPFFAADFIYFIDFPRMVFLL